jgi:hypothetical protein
MLYMSGSKDGLMFGSGRRREHTQNVGAGRDSYAAGRDLNITNKSNPVVVIAVFVVLAVVSATAGALAAYLNSRASSGSASSTSPQLVVDQVGLGYATVKGSDAQQFEIDVKLLNTGTQIAAINSATLTIDDFATIPECFSQGDFYSTGSYAANLPTSPTPGQVVNIPISQLVEANGADRFDLLLSVPLPKGYSRPNIYLYRVHLRVTYNAHEAPLDLGEIIVDFPDVPTPGDYFWSKYWSAHLNLFRSVAFSATGAVMSCDIKNSLALRSFLVKPGMRTAAVAGIAGQLAYN